MRNTLPALMLVLLGSPVLAAEKSPPNILFCIADDWGAHAGAYGTPWVKTPAFDRVARQGVLFNQAYTPNAKCAPSRACILTGRNSWQLEEAANHICYFPPKFKGWCEALAENGWFVGYTQKGWGPGVAQDENGKPRQMTGQPFNARKLKPPASGIGNMDYAANFVDFLDAAPKDKPWSFWYGCIEPHRGYEYGSGVAKGGKKLTDIDRVPAFWPDNEQVRNDMLDYAFEVEHFDRHLGRMLEELEKRGLLENTLVIVTADHGMPFPRSKGNAYEMSNHVPLAMMWKGAITAPGRKIDDFVSFIDLAPTFMEIANLAPPQHKMAEMTGRSLLPILKSDKSGRVEAARDHVLIGKERTDIGRPNDWGYPTRAIVTKEWIYVENFEPARWPAGNPETGYLDCDGGMTKSVILQANRNNPGDPYWQLCFGIRPPEELYHLAKDPDAVKNLAGKSDGMAMQSALREQLHNELRQQKDPRMEGKGDVFDKYPHANKGHVGFYEKFMAGEKLRTGWVSDSDYEKGPIKTPPQK